LWKEFREELTGNNDDDDQAYGVVPIRTVTEAVPLCRQAVERGPSPAAAPSVATA
jgi:hypothetical protein